MTLRSNGSYIGPRPAGPSKTVASGIWDLRTAQRQKSANLWTGEPVDEYFSNVSLLLHMDGSNGSTTFTNSSSNSVTTSARGSASLTTSEKKFGTASLNVPVAVNDGISLSSTGTLFQFAGDFTIEGWIFPVSLSADSSIYVASPDNTNYLAINVDSTNCTMYLNSGGVDATIAHGLTTNSWQHLAVVRSGSTVTLYVEGTSKGTATKSGTLGYISPSLHRIGGGGVGSAEWKLDEFRVTKGVARYAAGFTPPTAAFPDA